jgi:hypothetical protein
MTRIGSLLPPNVNTLRRQETQAPAARPSPAANGPTRAQDAFVGQVDTRAAKLLGQLLPPLPPPLPPLPPPALLALQQQGGGAQPPAIQGGPPPLTNTEGVLEVAYDDTDPVRDGSGPVGQVQQFLVQAGYLVMPPNTPYGYFGGLTTQAIMDFQAHEGIHPANGEMNEATLAAMQNPHPRADPTVNFLATTYREQLGRPTSPLETGPNGERVQHFEHGTITILPGGVTHVQDLAGQDIVPPLQPGTVSSTEQAEGFHLTQWGSATNPYNDGSNYYGGNDCGPASVIMAACMVGAMTPPGAAQAGETIDRVRDNSLVNDPDYDASLTGTDASQTTSIHELKTGAESVGASATVIEPSSMASIDAALAAGHPVVVGGDPFATNENGTQHAWGAETTGYLMEKQFGPHWVTVAGKTPEGNYIICDPLSGSGPIEVTPADLALFLRPGMGMLEVAPPTQAAA